MLRPMIGLPGLIGLSAFLSLTRVASCEPTASSPNTSEDVAAEHVVVYAEDGRFGGWPANHGSWSWGNEILVGFSAGYHKDLGLKKHNIDREKPEQHLLARSLDGGSTWTVEDPSIRGALIPSGNSLHGIAPPGLQERPWLDCPGGIDFTHPDFAMTIRMTNAHGGASRFYYSTDRGHNWQGPFRLPQFDTNGIAGRTDYLVLGKQDCILFLTAAKTDGREGRPLCVRTTDGGKTWKFIAWIGQEPKGYGIMPSSIRVNANELLSAIRCREGDRSWIETHRSMDLGQNWKLDAIPAPDLGEGNPASMIRMKDGRIALTYGVRAEPFEVLAKLSSDDGKSWGKPIVLRGNGGGRDIGYPRTVQRLDGRLVTIYYIHDRPESNRYIAATIWDPK